MKVGIASSEYARGVRTSLTRRMKLVPRFLMDSVKSNEHFFRPCCRVESNSEIVTRVIRKLLSDPSLPADYFDKTCKVHIIKTTQGNFEAVKRVDSLF